ncbi:N-acetyl-gamma-glutamyl-phosphate reductase [Desulfonatronovibrio magnus]|uniref:N-acetyl-gamma-glutamyl-phosphate reductase n=1 Tax=Desulfonatronovibrio magnus TaxID=698827 RepID=UPI0005EB0001|nr:N-acetyl-gamma-glutamyl-phosphate reductase [Desulfonatronovibrio magnus]RQD65469.1 MAG: N-acetyl-gamma-glutamyl-phosphate reductase [Desulfonatronovibrio sp. MSAO_Bac4]
MNKINAAVVGVTGYTGIELVRILSAHPKFELSAVTSRTSAGMALQDVFPHLYNTPAGLMAVTIPDPEFIARDCQLAFLAVPHGKAMDLAASLLKLGVKVVDLSADFRIKDAETYSKWYNTPHKYPELLPEAAYGLPEMYGPMIHGANLVANPGCYPTSVLLALCPGLKKGYIDRFDIIIDSKSGTSGAGRAAKTGTLYCEVTDSFKAYSLACHRHTPEMDQEFAKAYGLEVVFSFSPHLVPMSRGILSTCYVKRSRIAPVSEILQFYKTFFRGSPHVRILPEGKLPETRWVRGTMYCDIGMVHDKRSDRLIIVSCIDNLCRGASGQAVANANLMFNFDEELGLEQLPLMP